MAQQKLVIRKKKYQGVTSVVSARLPGDMIEDIDKVAEKTGYNRNEVIQMCLEYAIANLQTEGGRR